MFVTTVSSIQYPVSKVSSIKHYGERPICWSGLVASVVVTGNPHRQLHLALTWAATMM